MPAPPRSPPEAAVPGPGRRRGLRTAALAGASLVALLAVALYAARGPIGARLAVDYLKRRGVPAQITLERLTGSGLVARASFGPADDPDATVERMEVAFDAAPLLRGGLLAPRIRAVRLVRPMLKLSYDGRRLGFGALQPLVDEAARAPGGGPAPSVIVIDGRLRLVTPAGEAGARGDAAVDGGRLTRLSARIAPASLSGRGFALAIAGGALSAHADAAAITVDADLQVPQASYGGAHARGAQVQLAGVLPYRRDGRLDGPINLQAAFAAAELTGPGPRLAGVRLEARYAGAAAGPWAAARTHGAGRLALAADQAATQGVELRRFALAGPVTGLMLAREAAGVRLDLAAGLDGGAASLRAGAARTGQLTLAARLYAADGLFADGRAALSGRPQLSLAASDVSAGQARVGRLRFDLDGGQASLDWGRAGVAAAAPFALRVRAGAGRAGSPAGALRVASLGADLSGAAGYEGRGGARFRLAGSARAAGGLDPGSAGRLADATPVIGSDPAGRVAIARALQDVRVEAPAVSVGYGLEGWRLALPRPLVVASASGARAVVDASRPAAASVALSGGGLPEGELSLTGYRLGQDRGGATLSGQGRLDLGFSGATLGGARLSLAGPVARRRGVLSVAAAACGPVALARFGEASKPLVTSLSGRLCPSPGRALAVLAPGGWRFDARFEDVAFTAPESQAAVRGGTATLALAGEPRTGAPAGAAEILGGRLVDAAPMKRFEPLMVKGRAELARGAWSGPLHLAEAAQGRPVGEVRFVHQMETARGHADIEAPGLTFARGGLQPKTLSPIGADLVSDVEGTVRFTGTADWSPAGLTSAGRVWGSGIDFRSAFGRVAAAQGDIALTSLAPVLSAPAQPVSARSVDGVVLLTAPKAAVELRVDRIHVSETEAALSGGRLSLDPIDFPYDQTTGISGVVRLDSIDLGALVQRFNLADRIQIQARLSGAVPFTMKGGALRLNNGRVYATGPGRLTIHPEALTATAASAAPGAPAAAAATPPSMQVFAYQALQDLAFDKLDAAVSSQPMGRLGVLFHIEGRHDPPKGGDVHIGLLDLLRGKAFDKPVDLPKGTPVNLTLDTSLNLDELLAAYSGRSRSDSVQSSAAKP